jgi:hypothetical protein
LLNLNAVDPGISFILFCVAQNFLIRALGFVVGIDADHYSAGLGFVENSGDTIFITTG